MPQPGEEVLCLLITFWEAKGIWQKSPTEPYEWCLMELLEAILRVDGRCRALGCSVRCLRVCLQLGVMGLQIKGVLCSSGKGEKTAAPCPANAPGQGHILVSQELQLGAEPRWSSGKEN